MKSTGLDPRSLDVRSFCKSSEPLRGSRSLSEMERLSTSLAAASDAKVEWVAEGSLEAGSRGAAEHWLHLRAQVQVPLQCQRCLAVMLFPVAVDRHFRFVADEDQAAREDESSEEEVLVMPPRLEMHALLEDELILALPIVPRHPQACPQPLADLQTLNTTAADGLADSGSPGQTERDRPHPFASLASLRDQLGKKN